jgi:hypothetical protein
MRRLILARTLLAAMGVVVWGYGYRVDDPNVRLAGIALLAISLLLRFLPARWLGNDAER